MEVVQSTTRFQNESNSYTSSAFRSKAPSTDRNTVDAKAMQTDDKHPASVAELLEALRALKEEDPKAVRSTVHLDPASVYAPNADHDKAESEAEGSSSTSMGTRKITSWKMTEHMYFNANNKFPTLARGLFSEELDGEERIVARGYDKFFNTDETAWTNVCELQHPSDWVSY